VVANMIPGELVPLLPSLATLVRPHGFLLFSGVMADQLVGFTQELTRHRLTVNASKQLNEWVGLVCSPALN
jgi:ribosomal protein L11 methylase PrmA